MRVAELTEELAATDQRDCWRVRDLVPGQANIKYLSKLDSAADTVQGWSQTTIPGALRCEEYSAMVARATALPDTAECDIRDRAEALADRGRAFSRRAQGMAGKRLVGASFVIGQRAIETVPDGHTETHRRQLEHLLFLAALPQVTIRVYPDTGPMAWSPGHVLLYEVENSQRPFLERVVYAETVLGAHYTTRASDASHALRVFFHLRKASMSASISERLIRTAHAQL